MAVVMPAVDRSFYTDMSQRGNRYWTYISEELPSVARFLFPISGARKDNFVAGLSMGGYGAMKLGLTFPDRFAAAASLSGALDVSQLLKGSGKSWKQKNAKHLWRSQKGGWKWERSILLFLLASQHQNGEKFLYMFVAEQKIF